MKTTILFIVVCSCIFWGTPKSCAEGSWGFSINASPRYVESGPIPQYEIRRVPVYDACGRFMGYQDQQVFVGYMYPSTVYRQESVWFTFGNYGSHHGGHGDYRRPPQGQHDGRHH